MQFYEKNHGAVAGQLTDRNNITVWTNCSSLGPGLAALWNNSRIEYQLKLPDN